MGFNSLVSFHAVETDAYHLQRFRGSDRRGGFAHRSSTCMEVDFKLKTLSSRYKS